MKILVTGFTGYLGHMIYNHFGSAHEVYGTSSTCLESGRNYRCNLRHENEVAKLSRAVRPDVIIHAAGQKDISFCEKNANDAFAVNSSATAHLAKIFGDKSRIIYLSTDYVFDGKSGHYSETHSPNPLTIYGQSKLLGEIRGTETAAKNFMIVRTGVVYDDSSKYMNFLRENLELARAIDCYTDAFYAPAYYRDFLHLLEVLLLHSFTRNVFHVCGSRLSRYDFAILVAKTFRHDTSLIRPALRAAQHWYLYSDLSLTSVTTQAALNFSVTPHQTALQALATRAAHD